MVFLWGMDGGSMEDFTSTSTSSRLTWRAPQCVQGATAATIDGFVSDGSSTARMSFSVAVPACRIPAIAASYDHSLVLRADRTVWAWGENLVGQLGDGRAPAASLPRRCPGCPNITAISSRFNYSLALREDGTVWAWGNNRYGQLGDGTTIQRHTPVHVPGLTHIIAIATGDDHSLAMRADGTVWSWGYNLSGQLGDGTTLNRSIPSAGAWADERQSHRGGRPLLAGAARGRHRLGLGQQCRRPAGRCLEHPAQHSRARGPG